jgi:hypothetical protein
VPHETSVAFQKRGIADGLFNMGSGFLMDVQPVAAAHHDQCGNTHSKSTGILW